ncbi:hypothetical protein ABIC20_002484 [Methylobacterium radiotolerans]|uniref:Uncharacterized protein n=1 Tax=Methylobacterium radiotolerans TaxID=31998 RepID=A0ABV2NFE6_9HYPH
MGNLEAVPVRPFLTHRQVRMVAGTQAFLIHRLGTRARLRRRRRSPDGMDRSGFMGDGAAFHRRRRVQPQAGSMRECPCIGVRVAKERRDRAGRRDGSPYPRYPGLEGRDHLADPPSLGSRGHQPADHPRRQALGPTRTGISAPPRLGRRPKPFRFGNKPGPGSMTRDLGR